LPRRTPGVLGALGALGGFCVGGEDILLGSYPSGRRRHGRNRPVEGRTPNTMER
jgi:hypothetical protein